MLFDELGRAINLSQTQTNHITGKHCLSANTHAIQKISTLLSSSLGPNGMDKILQSKDDEITVTNDGATILKEMEMTECPVARMVVELSQAQDEEVGDGTTGIVVVAGALLGQAMMLVDKGVHPVQIADGYERACRMVIGYLEQIAEDIGSEVGGSVGAGEVQGKDGSQGMDDTQGSTMGNTNTNTNTNPTPTPTPMAVLRPYLLKAARTALNSKIVSKSLDSFAELCTEAVLSIADARKDVDFDLIRTETRTGRDIAETALIKGVLISKEFSHPQMVKEITDARIALLACPFEPPKIKTKHTLAVSSVEEYRELSVYEGDKFREMIAAVKRSGANVVMCQWGFDDEANCMLMESGLPAVRWVGGSELEMVAVHTKGSIISRFEDLRSEDLGRGTVREVSLGTENEKMIVVERGDGGKCGAVTVLVRGGNAMVMEEAKRCIRDGMCAVRNLMQSPKLIYGGGSSEIAASVLLKRESAKYGNEVALCMLGYAKALEEIPLCLARNSGYDPVIYVSELIKKQIREKKHTYGVDCLESGVDDMKVLGVFDSLVSKVRQLEMATQLVNMVLKIDEVINKEE